MKKHFRAPWGARLIGTTALFALILGVVFFSTEGWGRYGILAIFLVAAVFAIRGYSVQDGELLILRLGWSTRFDLTKLSSVEVSPGATMGSIRALGIGGLFGFVGHYHNSLLGSYRAYATDEANAVVLKLADQTIVVTPDSPEAFAQAVSEMSNGVKEAHG